MPLFRLMTVLSCLCLAMAARAYEPPLELPEPDYDRIRAMAQRTESGKEYVTGVIARLRECTDTATPYAESPITTDMVESKVIHMVCLNEIMAKLEELYFEPDSFGEGGIKARIDELKNPLYAIYLGAHNGHWGCDGRFCGTAAASLFPRDDYVWFLLDLTEYIISFSAAPGQLPDDWRVKWAEAAEFKISPPKDAP
jgi:hypothetical protein